MAAASGGYKYLSGTQVGAWNSFAKNSYTPVNGRVGVEYSGANAYMGLRTSAMAGAEVGQEGSFIQDESPIDAGNMPVSFNPVDSAPDSGLSATIDYDGAGSLGLLSLKDVIIDTAYKAIATISFNKLSGSGASITQFDSQDGVSCGFALYISTPNKGQGRRFKQKLANTQFIIQPPTLLTGSPTDGDITITQLVAAPVSEWLSAYVLGDYVLASLYLIAADGRRALLGTKEVRIMAA